MKKYICCSIAVVLMVHFAGFTYGQVTPPGQGGKLVIWTALEIDQSLSKRWSSQTTFGIGRHSDTDDYAIVEQKGTFTIREGMAYKLSKHLTLSLTAIYAQRSYYEEKLPPYQQEIRVYPKLKHSFNVGRLAFSQYIRFDLRRFFQPNWSAWKNPFEFRPRYQLKASLLVSKNNRNFIVLITEMMGAAKAVRQTEGGQSIQHMQPFQFTENRSSLYFRHHLKKLNWYIDLGVMHQYWQQQANHFESTLLFGADVVIKKFTWHLTASLIPKCFQFSLLLLNE